MTYAITVSNTGTEDIDNLTLTDDLATQFGTALVGVIDGPTVTGDLTPARGNTAYDGDTDIALITTDLTEAVSPGEEFVVTFTVTVNPCLLYTSPSPRDQRGSRMPSSA